MRKGFILGGILLAASPIESVKADGGSIKALVASAMLDAKELPKNLVPTAQHFLRNQLWSLGWFDITDGNDQIVPPAQWQRARRIRVKSALRSDEFTGRDHPDQVFDEREFLVWTLGRWRDNTTIIPYQELVKWIHESRNFSVLQDLLGGLVQRANHLRGI